MRENPAKLSAFRARQELRLSRSIVKQDVAPNTVETRGLELSNQWEAALQMSSPHKPRRKTNRASTPATSSNLGPSSRTSKSKVELTVADFPLVAFFTPAKGSTSQWVILPLIFMVIGLFRWTVGFWGYSGFQAPPMYGDYEAQRHWMEVTTHVPISQWYFHDLEYWGLDYPPLTAYHSWVLGKIGSYINPSWFALDASRGLESQDSKVFMRATVLVSEFLTYIPAMVIFNRRLAHLSGVGIWESSIALTAILMQPATLLIDHGHFQYNTVMLGLTVASMSSMLAGRLLWSCVFFVGALAFKQMALYFAPAIFAYLLGVCANPKINPLRFIAIAAITLISFGVVFAPLLLGAEYNFYQNPKALSGLKPPYLYDLIQSKAPFAIKDNVYLYPIALQLTQAVHRIFPLARGLFEDKVANVWCAIHTVYKLNRLPLEVLSRLSLLATVAAMFPSCVVLFLRPRKSVLPYALASCAWAFFLCSFQVHEKSVLLPLLPMTILLGGQGGLAPDLRAWIGWANILGCWTMFPLLKRDDLRVPYVVVTLLWAYLLGLPPTSFSLYLDQRSVSTPIKLVQLSFYAMMATWHVLEAFVAPPTDKPDLWVVLNCIIGAIGFGICYLWCTWNAILKSGLTDNQTIDSTLQSSRKAVSDKSANGTVTKAQKRKP